MGRVWVGAAALVALFLGGCATQPLPDMTSATLMSDAGRAAPAPAGFISFCLRRVDQCELKPGAQTIVSLDKQTWQTLARINHDVNAAIWPMDDIKHYGRAEYWEIPTDGYGVCHAYALTKRKLLSDAGLPLAALRLAVVYSARSGRHAVLTVTTDKGDFVLDNMTGDILSWDATDYTWIERQDGTDPFRWVALRPERLGAQPTEVAAADNPVAQITGGH